MVKAETKINIMLGIKCKQQLSSSVVKWVK